MSPVLYTPNGNLLSSATDALGNVTNYSYDADTGVLEWVQLPEDSDSTRTEYTYDDMYRQASIVADTDSQLNLSVNYTYTDEDLLATLQTPSTTYMFDYGDFDQLTAVRIGSRTLVSYAYDSKKQLDRTTYGNNDFVDNDYDAKGRLIRKTYETGQTVEYAYDNSGNLATVTDSATGIITTYYYDLLDRQVGYREKSATLDHSVTCIYNEDNQVSSVTEVINGVTTTYSYTYDQDNRVTSVAVGNLTVSYTYDGFGRLASRTVKNGDTVIQSSTPAYSAGKEANTTTGQISSYNGYTYTYDKNGNILSVTDGTYTTSYEYDSANQLTRENNQQLGFTHTWTYDNGGNITGRSEYPYTTGTLGTPTNTVAYTYKSSTIWGDMIDSYGASDYLPHDGAGNLRYDGTWIYNWENGRELTSMTQGETAWTFSYDANGMRTKRTDGTAQSTYTYVYDGSQLVQMTVEGYTLDFLYDASGTPLAFSMGSMSFYYDTNLQGDVVAIRDTSGNVLVQYAYDAWGNFEIIQNHQIAEYNPLLYRGYVYDHEIGLYYLQSRYYDPEWGRFINGDSQLNIGEGVLGCNMYAYCLNNPVNGYDSCGTCFHRWDFWNDCDKCGGKNLGTKIGDAVSAVGGAVVSAVKAVGSAVVSAGKAVGSAVVSAGKAVGSAVVSAGKAVGNAAVSAWNWTKGAVQTAWGGVKAAGRAVGNFVVDRFSTPEKASNTLSAIGWTLDSAAAYCGGVAAGFSIPTLGMSIPTAGSAAAILVMVSLLFHGAALAIDIINEA